ncbi:MAG: cytochrome c [Planctomycetes bacterium]|nr:cytochrome c [Planctomycetota bacterium]
MRSLRWLTVLACAAIAFGALGYSVAQAQAVEKIPDAELPAGVKDAGDFAAKWDGSGDHPGKKLFDGACASCHSLGSDAKVGPGLAGLYDRVSKGPAHEGKPVQQRLLEFVKTTEPGGPDKYSADPYFKSVQESVAGPGVQMSARGALAATVTDREILDVIDYILRFRGVDFVEADYLKQVALGRELVSGAKGFEYGGPSCTGCHTAGADHSLRGANLAGNIADTYVLARRRGKDEKRNFADGLQDILSGPNAPAAHHYYKDEVGSGPLTEAELLAVTTFFEQQAREVGTERDSNYLPIFALLAAALLILLLEPSVLNVLFVKEDHEFIDGPYAEEEHHDGHESHEHVAEQPAEASAKAEEKPAEASTPVQSAEASPETEDKTEGKKED